MEKRCKHCQHFNSADLTCRKSAPSFYDQPAGFSGGGIMRVTGWPKVTDEDWCGEFSPAPSFYQKGN